MKKFKSAVSFLTVEAGKSEVSKSPTSISLSGQKDGDSDEEYLYANTVHRPPQHTPTRRRNRKMPPSRQGPPAYTNFPHFESSSLSPPTIRKRPLTPIRNAAAKDTKSGVQRKPSFSPLTLTQSRCDEGIQVAKTGEGISESSIHARSGIRR